MAWGLVGQLPERCTHTDGSVCQVAQKFHVLAGRCSASAVVSTRSIGTEQSHPSGGSPVVVVRVGAGLRAASPVRRGGEMWRVQWPLLSSWRDRYDAGRKS